MVDEARRRQARDPQDLERLLIARQWAGEVDEMAALFRAACPHRRRRGAHDAWPKAIRALFAEIVATGRKFRVGNSESGHHQRRPGAHVNAPSRWQRDR